MIRESDLRELAMGTFELRCGSLHLHTSGAAKEEGSIGSGYLRQLPMGELSLVMFIGAHPPPHEIVWNTTKRSGELFTDEDYYTLEALDFAGRRWTASRVRPNFTQVHREEAPLWMAEATLRELQGKATLGRQPAGSSLQLWYRGDVEFPFQAPIRQVQSAGEKTLHESIAIAAAEFRTQSCDFFVRHDSGYLVVSVSSLEERFEPGLERRVHEAMEFVLARRLAWAAVERRDGAEHSWRLTGAPTNDKGGRMQPPVAFTPGSRMECEAALDLFGKYFDRIRSHRGEGLPLLSVAVKSALEGARSPLDAHALDVAIAVEAILSTEYSERGQATEQFQSELTRVREAIESLAISEEAKQRVIGRLSSLTAASAKSRLLDLVARGVIDTADVRAWEVIRHPSAHGAFIAGVSQDYMDAFWRVMTLLYRLIFGVVGYEGPYRAYGELDWPWRNRE